MSHMPHCDWCKEAMVDEEAVLYGPENNNNINDQFDICDTCYDSLKELLSCEPEKIKHFMIRHLMDLTNQQRLKIFYKFCLECGEYTDFRHTRHICNFE